MKAARPWPKDYEMLDARIRLQARRREIGVCEECGKRPATQKWVGEAGALAYIHGFYQNWCDQCCVKAQLLYALQRGRAIPGLLARWLWAVITKS